MQIICTARSVLHSAVDLGLFLPDRGLYLIPDLHGEVVCEKWFWDLFGEKCLPCSEDFMDIVEITVFKAIMDTSDVGSTHDGHFLHHNHQ